MTVGNERIDSLVEGYIKEQKNDIENCKRKIELWQSAERKRTKSGGDFKTLNRNFDDRTDIYQPYLGSWYVDRHGIIDGTYTEDRIYIIHVDEDVAPTPDEVTRAISDKIEALHNRIANSEKAIENVPSLEECLRTVSGAIDKALSAGIASWYIRDNISKL